MDNLTQQIGKFGSLDVWGIVKKVVEQEKAFLIDLVTEQLSKGETRNGRTRPYSNSELSKQYLSMKLALGRIDSSILPHANLYNEGDFHERIDIMINEASIEVLSTDSKALMLERKYSKNIYLPNSERMGRYKSHILPLVLGQIRQHLGYVA